MRDWSGAAQKAAHISALNFGWVGVSVSVIDQGCVEERGRSITRDVSAPMIGVLVTAVI